MGELASEYEGRVEFNVIPAEETNRRAAEIASYGFAEKRHGLVGFTSEGEAIFKLAGHDYGKDKIEEAVRLLLAGES